MAERGIDRESRNVVLFPRVERPSRRQFIFDRSGHQTAHEAKTRSDGRQPAHFRIQRIEPMTQKFNNQVLTAKAVSLEVKASDSGRIEGYASTTGGDPDRHGDIVISGAFTKSLQRQKASGDMPVMLWSHAQEQPIGRWIKMHEDSQGLFVEGNLNLNTSKGREAYEHVKAGDAGGLSIGFTVPEGGREYAGKGVFHLKAVDVQEVSIVAIPANPLARITGVKSLQSRSDAIDMLRECGLSKKAAKRFAAGGYQALIGDDEHHEKAIQLAARVDAAIKAMKTKA